MDRPERQRGGKQGTGVRGRRRVARGVAGALRVGLRGLRGGEARRGPAIGS